MRVMDIVIKGLPRELKDRIREAGLFTRTYGYYAAFGFILTFALLGCIALLFYIEMWWQVIVASICWSIVFGQFGFLGHDIAHRQVFDSRKKEAFYGELIWGLVLGMSMIWWRKDHNEHHQETNKIDHDTQINEQFVFSPEQIPYIGSFQRKYILPIQHYLFFPVTATMYGAITLSSWYYLIRALWRAPDNLLLLTEAWLITVHFALLFAIVFTALSVGQGILFLITLYLFSGLASGLAFAPNHKGEKIVREDEEVTFLTQIECTRNIEPSWFNDLILGSLNYQIEHHLFPMLPRPHLRHARAIVKEYCREHNIIYHETTLVGSYVEIIQSLKENALLSRSL